MRRLALIGFLALISSACTLDVNIGVLLTPSGSGTVSVDIATDDEFESLFALTGREFEDLVASRGRDVGLSFVVITGDKTRYFAEGSEVSPRVLEDMLEGLAPGIGPVDVTATESALELDAQLSALTDIGDVAVYFEGTDPAQFEDDVSVTLNLSVPGTLDSSTASSTGAGDLTWQIPFSNEPTRVFARSILQEEGSSSFSWTAVVISVAIIPGQISNTWIRSSASR